MNCPACRGGRNRTLRMAVYETAAFPLGDATSVPPERIERSRRGSHPRARFHRWRHGVPRDRVERSRSPSESKVQVRWTGQGITCGPPGSRTQHARLARSGCTPVTRGPCLWTRRESNPRPLGCEPSALPAELRAPRCARQESDLLPLPRQGSVLPVNYAHLVSCRPLESNQHLPGFSRAP